MKKACHHPVKEIKKSPKQDKYKSCGKVMMKCCAGGNTPAHQIAASNNIRNMFTHLLYLHLIFYFMYRPLHFTATVRKQL